MARWVVIMMSVVTSLALDAYGANADGIRVVRNVDYVGGEEYADDKDKLDLYLPEAEDFPVVVFFHGGGLLRGDKSGSEHVGMALAAAGIGAAIANYRLSPSVEHPAHAEDAARSIAWVHRHIEEHDGDRERVFLSGHSAGAYLAALLVLDARYLRAEGLDPRAIAGSLPISGFFYVDQVAPDRPKTVWGTDKEGWKEASPDRYLRSDAPPLLFLYADGDDPWRRQQNEDVAAELLRKGHSDVATVQISERDHLGIHQSIAFEDPTLEAMRAFIETR